MSRQLPAGGLSQAAVKGDAEGYGFANFAVIVAEAGEEDWTSASSSF
jgi:hypothetical protein